MKRCLDEGVLQAYADGELSHESALGAAEHLAVCERCAASLAEVEGEGAFLASAFAPDDSLSVPTEHLRARISAAVARLEPQAGARERTPGGWSLGALLAPLTSLLTFAPQRAAAFAGVLAVVVLAAVFFSVQESSNDRPAGGRQSAGGGTTTPPTPPNNNSEQVAGVVNTPTVTKDETEKGDGGGEVAIHDKGNGRGVVTAAKYARPRHPKLKASGAKKALTASPAEQPLPGEKDYEQAIASLTRVINSGGDAVLKPQVRAEYERNIAVLDKAIEETRRVARRNPKDRDAVGFLMSSYQSKVELLTTVADQAQVAALGR